MARLTSCDMRLQLSASLFSSLPGSIQSRRTDNDINSLFATGWSTGFTIFVAFCMIVQLHSTTIKLQMMLSSNFFLSYRQIESSRRSSNHFFDRKPSQQFSDSFSRLT